MWRVLVLCAVTGLLVGCSKDKDQRSHSVPYVIRMPSGWEQSENADGTLVIAAEPVSGTSDLPRTSLNLVVGRSIGPLTMDDYWALSRRSLKEAVGPYKEHESGEIRMAGVPWRWMIYSFDSRTFPGTRMKCLVYATRTHGYTYAITGGTTVEKFDIYRPLFEQTARTFELR